jgi:PAS domain S-box-containing protein
MSKSRRKQSSLIPAAVSPRPADSDMRIRALLHELQVHSEEIAAQNEQLTKTQHELELSRDRYADLYDFAPIGYTSLDRHGFIQEINLAGAALLGRQRSLLIGLPFVSRVMREERERVRDFISRVLNGSAPSPHVEVRLAGGTVDVRLLARPLSAATGDLLFVVMLDVTQEHRLAEEKQLALEREQQRTAELARENATRVNAEEQVRALLERLVDVQEKERRRLALNLHDQLGQQLVVLRLSVDVLRSSLTETGDVRRQLDAIEDVINQLDRDLDSLAWELRPAALDEVGLDAALAQLVGQWSRVPGFDADFLCPRRDGPRLHPNVELHLFRIVQEGLSNVSKHARASHASVLLDRRTGEVRLTIEDDGVGFDVNRAGRSGGMGLAGMQERASAIGGELHLESAPGRGTTLFVRVPVTAANSV